jgi:pimeloyl-ACP methyl ester carboxylesterase
MVKLQLAAFAAIAASALAGAGAAQVTPQPAEAELAVYARPQRLVQLPDGRRMNLYCTGRGAPTVILEGGWTTTTMWWRTIQARVAATTRVCSYDRAGYGFSDPGPLPRSAAPIARDLGLLLQAAGERGPYIVVAHSLGGLDARLFAVQHRRAVKGMLLIDPTVPGQVATMGAVSASYKADMDGLTMAVAKCAQGIVAGTIKPDTRESRPCVDPASKSLPDAINAAHRAQQLTAGYQRTAASELQSLDLSSREVEAGQRHYGAMPLIVMTAGKSNFNPDLPAAEQARLDAAWFALHGKVARLSRRGQHRLIADASHFIPKDDPDAVVAAIDTLVRETR